MSEKRLLLEGTKEVLLPITFDELKAYLNVNVTLYRGGYSFPGIVFKMVWDKQEYYRLRMSDGSHFAIEPLDIIRSSVGGATFVFCP